jgi:RNA polymerase sigma-70 factor (ECF subfamily)
MGSTNVALLGRLRDLTDARAWQEFQDTYRPRLYAWCRRKGLQHADAENVTQEVLLRVARRMPTFSYEPGSNFSGWLYTVWRNAWLDYLNDSPPAHETLHENDGVELATELKEELDRELLHEALARVQPVISRRDWDIFHDFLAGKASSEIARERGMTVAAVGMVKTRVQRQVSAEVARLSGGP